MYENLLRLPYFQGMGKNELTSILEKIKLNFTQHEDGEDILLQNSKCDNFAILLQGAAEVLYTSHDNNYKLIEEIKAPYAIEPYSLFGAQTEYRRTYKAKGNCNMLFIDKSYFYNKLNESRIFSMNLLNLISHRAQSIFNTAISDTPQSIEGRIVHFIALRSEISYGSKNLIIKMEYLATQLSETRLNISRALNNLQQRDLVKLSRKEIYIPSFENLVNAIQNT